MTFHRKTLIKLCFLAVFISACIPPKISATPTSVLPPGTATVTLSPATPIATETAVFTSTATPAPVFTATTTLTPAVTPTVTATITSVAPSHVTFAVIGDFGQDGKPLQDVSNLIESWKPDLIITTGDNNYPAGSAGTIDQNIGKYFHEYISPYKGQYGQGADQNRFFPSLGNHDWLASGAKPYLDYFTLPGNERYYDFTWGPVEFFAIDSDGNEPDGVGRSSVQAKWLQGELSRSTSTWKIVYFHHPPYSSSSYHGSTDWMQWPFQEWGASAVLAGHDHTYERLLIDGIPYFVDGLGGGAIYGFGTPLPGSEVRYAADYGAMRVEATDQSIIFEFINRQGQTIDTYTLNK